MLLLLLLLLGGVVGRTLLAPPFPPSLRRLRHGRHEHLEPPCQCLFHRGGRQCDTRHATAAACPCGGG